MGRPRKIRPLEEAAGTPQIEVPENGICFANNHPNREFTTAKGAKFKFSSTRQYFTDQDQIAVLNKLAEDQNSRIFRIDPEPDPDEPQETQILAAEPEEIPAENTEPNV